MGKTIADQKFQHMCVETAKFKLKNEQPKLNI